jgi:type VI secretion system protein ImpC
VGSPLDKLQALASAHPPSLPLKMLVVADCAGRDGEAVPVTTPGVQGLLEALRPSLRLQVPDKIAKSGAKMALSLEFKSLEDFRPSSLVSNSPALSEAAASADPVLAEQLDEILHHPEYQRLEACWLGLDRLAKALTGAAHVQLEVVPATRKNLGQSFHQAVFEPGSQSTTDVPVSAVYFDFRFSHEPADLALLEVLAWDCAALQTPMIAAAAPAFFQLKNLAHLPNLSDLPAMLQQPAYANWRRFQEGLAARWVCLTANRFLAREPYQLSRGPDSAFDYQEKAEVAHPENYLWAEAGWLASANLLRSFEKYRHCVVIDGMSPEAAHFNLPVRPFPKKANVMVPSPTEILIDDTKAWEIIRSGITILVGISDGAVATFPLMTNAYRLRPGVLTTESTLAYQMIAGRLSHYVASLYEHIPFGEGAEAIDAFLKPRLHEFLIPFAGEPDESVRSEVAESKGEPLQRMLNITVTPNLKLQDRILDFTLQLAFPASGPR